MSKTKKRIEFVSFIFGFIFLSINVRAVELLENGKVIIPDRISEVIKIDGNLNEKVWSNEAISKEFFTFYPVVGEILDHKTKVWMAYDNHNLYFAFKCLDSEPGKIKTSISRRMA
jgi:hypothetical protein